MFVCLLLWYLIEHFGSVMVSIQDFDSCDPSSILGRTSFFNFELHEHDLLLHVRIDIDLLCSRCGFGKLYRHICTISFGP